MSPLLTFFFMQEAEFMLTVFAHLRIIQRHWCDILRNATVERELVLRYMNKNWERIFNLKAALDEVMEDHPHLRSVNALS